MSKAMKLVMILGVLMSSAVYAVDTHFEQIKASSCDKGLISKNCTTIQNRKLEGSILQCCRPAKPNLISLLTLDSSVIALQNENGCKCPSRCINVSHIPNTEDGGVTGDGGADSKTIIKK